MTPPGLVWDLGGGKVGGLLHRVRLAAENNRLKQEVELLREGMRLKDARMARIHPRHRPHYRPIERMAILELKAVRGWTIAQTSREFLVEPATGSAPGADR